MSSDAALTVLNTPAMQDAVMFLALTGWMDGGLVSTGTVRHLMSGRRLVEIARIEPGGFYIDNFPGSMEVTALFRPHVKYEDGLVTAFDMPFDEFFADPAANMVFFIGKEPNLNWPGFAKCIFEIASRLNVKRIIFMGSFGGSVPHTREPRLFGSVSEARLKPILKEHGLRPSNYDGPGSFATYLLTQSPKHGIEMLSIAAEIPGYLQGLNPLSIEAVCRRLSHLFNLPVDLPKLREISTAWEMQVSEAVEKDPDLAQTVKKLEAQYDNELIGAVESE
jgi:proteasome assembly chaperone (PAC2) family protein